MFRLQAGGKLELCERHGVPWNSAALASRGPTSREGGCGGAPCVFCAPITIFRMSASITQDFRDNIAFSVINKLLIVNDSWDGINKELYTKKCTKSHHFVLLGWYRQTYTFGLCIF